MNGYESVIGLEVHVQLLTESKAFCSCSTKFGAPPNTNICPVCLGLPGSLPVINQKAVEYSIKTGLALNCSIAGQSKFDRKNYYYPDLPKNYQISQYDMPLCNEGRLEIEAEGGKRKIGILRIHLEEDAGKLLHSDVLEDAKFSYVDYNRAGTPLMEIVTHPDLRTPEEAYQYLTSLKEILKYIGVSDCYMEEGSLRCDANVSIRPVGHKELCTKTELKNMNTFKGVQKALEYEIERQYKVVTSGGKITQETRLWNSDKAVTISMRSKEEAQDYRYFPDPDLVNISITKEMIEGIRATLPELPEARKTRFLENYRLPAYDVGVLTAEKATADYFESCLSQFNEPKTVSNWVMVELLGRLNEKGISIGESKVKPEGLGAMLRLLGDGTISGKMAKDIFTEMFETGKAPGDIIKEKNLVQITDSGAIEAAVDKVMAANPNIVKTILEGKTSAAGFLVGQVMKETGGKANPKMVNALIRGKLGLEEGK